MFTVPAATFSSIVACRAVMRLSDWTGKDVYVQCVHLFIFVVNILTSHVLQLECAHEFSPAKLSQAVQVHQPWCAHQYGYLFQVSTLPFFSRSSIARSSRVEQSGLLWFPCFETATLRSNFTGVGNQGCRLSTWSVRRTCRVWTRSMMWIRISSTQERALCLCIKGLLTGICCLGFLRSLFPIQ